MMARPAVASVSRKMGNSYVSYLLPILVLGLLFVSSSQYEIHSVFTARDTHGVEEGANVGSKDLTSAVLQISYSLAEVDADPSGLSEATDVLSSNNDASRSNSFTQRKLESHSINSSETAQHRGADENHLERKLKETIVEEYVPWGPSVQANIVSAKFQLVIKVLAVNNYSSLVRCLSSLARAEYAGDSVDIHIYIDHFEISDVAGLQRRLLSDGPETEGKASPDGEVLMREGNENAPSKSERIRRKKERSRQSRKLGGDDDASEETRVPDRVRTGGDSVRRSDWGLIEQKLRDARRVLRYVESFHWKNGRKVIHYTTKTAGSQSQWVDAWYPSSDDEFALFVEDDAELSPLFYRYVRALIATYYYQWSHHDRSLYGISLQRPQIVPGKNGRPLKVDDRTRLFKYQMVGIWGQVFFPKPWKEFRVWYDTRRSHDVKPEIGGMVTTDWYQLFGEKIFTPWFVKFAYGRGYFNLYTNFLRDRVLSVTHRDAGGKSQNYSGCDSVLIWENGTYDIDLWHMANSWDIKRYDYCFKEVRVGRFANRTADVSWVVSSAQQDKKVLMVSTVGVPQQLVRNFLCKLRKLGIENYLVVGEDHVLLEDLARRGHASMRIENKGNLKEDLEKEVSVISDVLEMGNDVWFARADTTWIGNPLAIANTDGGDVIGVEDSKLKLFFIRNTEEVVRLWGSFNQELSQISTNTSRLANWERARKAFLASCQEEEKVRIRALQEVVFFDGGQMAGPPTVENGGGSVDAQVVVFSGMRSSKESDIRRKLGRLNLWNLDNDLGCAELTC